MILGRSGTALDIEGLGKAGAQRAAPYMKNVAEVVLGAAR